MKPVAPTDLWDQLDAMREEIIKAKSMPPGSGWFAPEDYAAHKNLNPEYAKDMLFKLHKAGKLERWQNGNRKAFYRIANGRTGH